MAFAAPSDFTAMPMWSMLNIKESPSHLKMKPELFPCQLPHNLLHQSIRIALMLGDFRGVARYSTISQLLARPLQKGVAQHLQQTILPVLGFLLQNQVFLLQIRLVVLDRS